MRLLHMSFAAIVLSAAIAATGFQSAGKPQAKPPAKPGYADVAPIFKKNCVACHSGSKPKEGLRLDSYEGILKGAKNGKEKVIVRKNPAKSKLMLAVRHKAKPYMPPGKTLPKANIALLDKWIALGAPKARPK